MQYTKHKKTLNKFILIALATCASMLFTANAWCLGEGNSTTTTTTTCPHGNLRLITTAAEACHSQICECTSHLLYGEERIEYYKVMEEHEKYGSCKYCRSPQSISTSPYVTTSTSTTTSPTCTHGNLRLITTAAEACHGQICECTSHLLYGKERIEYDKIMEEHEKYGSCKYCHSPQSISTSPYVTTSTSTSSSATPPLSFSPAPSTSPSATPPLVISTPPSPSSSVTPPLIIDDWF